MNMQGFLGGMAALGLLAGCATGPERSDLRRSPPVARSELPGAVLQASRGPGLRSGSPAAPLPMEQCLDPDRARSWVMIDSDELLVDAGRNRYHLRLDVACPELGTAIELVFRGGGGLGRLCGSAFDAVLPLSRSGNRMSCGVAQITVLDETTWQRYADGEEELLEDD